MNRSKPNVFIFEPLERRLLLSADALPMALAPGALQIAGGQLSAPLFDTAEYKTDGGTAVEAVSPADFIQDGAVPAASGAEPVPATTAADQPLLADTPVEKLIFINENIADPGELSAYLSATDGDMSARQIITLDSATDGISQITATLNKYENINAIHVFSHGATGTVQLGSTWLNNDNIASFQEEIGAWASSLSEQADILLYGCNLAENASGKQLIDTLSTLTASDVAASDNPTGQQSLGGDWLLEYHSGPIEALLPVSPAGQQDWLHLLVDQTISDDFTGGYAYYSGSVDWAGAWSEIGETTNANLGNVQIVSGKLQIFTADNNQTIRGISRTADLSTATAAYLSFDYSTVDVSGHGEVALQIRINSGASWTTLRTYETDDSSGQEFIDVSLYKSATTEIRFISEGKDVGVKASTSTSDGTGYFAIDNIKLEYSTTSFENFIWLTTEGNLSDNGQPGFDTWREGDLIQFGNPNLVLEDGINSANRTTNGTFRMGANISSLISDKNISAFHYVSSNMVIGASGFQLYAGDLLLSSRDASNFNGLLVTNRDVVVYHPDSPGDYSAGTFTMLMKNLSTKEIRAMTLVEQDTVVGDTTLKAGEFLFVEDLDTKNIIKVFHTVDVGPTSTSGTVTTLVDGEDAKVNLDEIFGIDLVERSLTFGGRTLNSGEILLSSKSDATVGNNNLAVKKEDLFVISIAAVSGNATASLVFEGADIGLSGDSERIDGFSLVARSNSPATATNLDAPETYTEDTPLNLTEIVISDVDGNQVTATLTLSDSAAGTLSTATAGSVSSTFVGGVWTASGDLTDVNSLLAGVSFTPTLNYDRNFTITTSVDDGIGFPVTGIKNMTAIPVNDAPTATNLNIDEDFIWITHLNLADITISDVDSSIITATLILGDSTAGTLGTGTSGAVTSTFSFGTWQASGDLADVNILLQGVEYIPAFMRITPFNITTIIDDGIAPVVTGLKNMTPALTFFPPTATNLSAAESYTEDISLDLKNIVISDIDSANVTATLTLLDVTAGSLSTATSGAVTSSFVDGIWTASGARADVNTLLAGVIFSPSLNYNGNFSIQTSVSDGINSAITGVKVFTGTPVDDPPAATNLNKAESYTEDTVLILTDIVISDVDSSTVSATLALSDIGAGSFNIDTSNLVTSSFDSGTGIWSATGLLADVNALLAGVEFTPTLNYNSNFTITTSVDDGGTPVTGSKLMIATAVNDAPTATNLDAVLTYTEDTSLDLPVIVISDIDSADITATLTLSDPAAGTLSTATSGLVISSFADGVWTASGALADVNILLSGVQFIPTADYNLPIVITTSVDDGTATPITGSFDIDATAVNDVPTIESTIADQVLDEDFASYTIDLNAAFTDVETIDSLLSYSVSDNTNINVSLAGGIATISSSANWNGSETLTFTATDAGTPIESVSQNVVFTVNPVNDVPTIESTIAAQDLAEDFTSYTIDLNAAFADIETIDSLLSYSVSGNSNINVSLASGIATISSSANWNGSETLTFTATDAGTPGLAASQAVLFTVNPVNDVPTIESTIADQVLDEDFTSYTIDLNAAFTDVETIDSLLSYSVSDNTNINVSLAGGIATISSSANWNGSETLTFTATDAGTPIESVSQNVVFTVNPVNDVPTIESTIAAQDLAEDFTSYTIDLNAAFADIETIDSLLSYSVSGNTNIDVSLAGGIATISSTANWNGSETLTFTATDAGMPGLAVSQGVLFTVSAVNDTPTIESIIPAQNLDEDFASYTIDLNAAFADIETIDSLLSYSVSGNTNINVSLASGIATISSSANWNGSETLTFTATDAGTPGLAVGQAVLFTVSAVNDVPTIESTIPAQNLAEDFASYTIDLNAAFADIETIDSLLNYSVSGNSNINVSLAGGIATISSTANWFGSETLTFTATDAGTPGLAVSQDVVFTVSAVNDVPTIESTIADQVLDEDFASYTIDLNAAFTDIETIDSLLNYSVSGNTNINVSLAGGIATISSSANWNGSETLTFTATDAGSPGLAASQDVLFSVNPVNDAPTIENIIPAQNLDEDFASYTIDLNAAFADIETIDSLLSYGFSGNSNINVSIAGGIATISSTANWNGSETLTFSATDAGTPGLAVSQDVLFIVNPVNDAPTIESTIPTQNLAEDFASYTIDLNAAFADIETIDANLIFGVSGNTNINVSIAGGIATISSTANWNGDETLTFTATDAGTPGLAVGQAVLFTVSAVNDTPTIENIIPAQNLDEDFASYTIDLNAAFADIETIDSLLSYGFSGNSNINVSIAGGIATISSTANWNGSETLTFSATDAGTPGLAVSQDVLFIVNPVNDAPTIESTIPTQNLAEDFASYTIDLNAAFADIETIDANLIFGVSGNTNINVSIAGGIATISSTANWNGDETLTFTATDAGTPGLAVGQAVLFTVSAVNDTPTIENIIPAQNLDEDFASYTIDLNAAFADIETIDSLLSYGFSGNSNINVSIAGGIATISSTANWNGSETLTFSATDAGMPGLAASQAVLFTVSAVNDAPTIESTIPTQNLAEDFASYTIDLNAAFADIETIDANLIFGVSGNTNINVSIAGGIATISSTANWNGDETLTFTATDAGTPGLAVGQAVLFTVSAVNDTPTIENIIPAQNLDEDFASYTIDLNAAFADIETIDSLLSYGFSGNSNINVSIAGGIATISSTANWNGSETLTFTATDAGMPGLAASQAVLFTVSAVNDAPTVMNLNAAETYTEDTPLNLTDIVISDIDNANVTATLILSDAGAGTLSTATSGGVTSTFTSGVWTASGALADVNSLLAGVVFNPAANYNSPVDIITSVDDGAGPPLTGTLNIMGIPVADTPRITSVSTDLAIQSGLIFITPNNSDGPEVTHFRISGITNGALFLADGITTVHTGDFITLEQGATGLRFTPNSAQNGTIAVASSEDGATIAAQSNTAVAVITINFLPPVLPSPIDPVLPPDSTPDVPDVVQQVKSPALTPLNLDVSGKLDTTDDDDREDTTTTNDSDEQENSSQHIVNSQPSSAADFKFDLILKQAAVSTLSLQDLNQMEQALRSVENEVIRHDLKSEMNEVLNLIYQKRSLLETQMLRNSLDSLRDETAREARFEKTIIGSAIAATTSLSAGYVIWLIRSGVLLSSLLSSMPAWQLTDPMAILTSRNRNDEDDTDDSLESIIESGGQKSDTPSPDNSVE